MAATTSFRNQFSHLRRAPGPGRGWQATAARELGYSAPHVSRLLSGKAKSPAGQAALRAWMKKNKIKLA